MHSWEKRLKKLIGNVKSAVICFRSGLPEDQMANIARSAALRPVKIRVRFFGHELISLRVKARKVNAGNGLVAYLTVGTVLFIGTASKLERIECLTSWQMALSMTPSWFFTIATTRRV